MALPTRSSRGWLRVAAATALTGSLTALGAAGAQAAPADQPAAIAGTAGELDYYVSAASGSDSGGDGSAQHPWASIGKAAGSVSLGAAGTVVHVAPGTYTSIVHNTKSGAPGAYLTFQADTEGRPWSVKVATGGGLRDFPFRNDGSYVRVIGFDVTSTTAWSGILSYGTHNVFAGNHVHNINPPCSGSPGGQGIGDDASSSDNTFIGNLVNNIGPYPKACQYIHGIYPSGAGDVVQNNIADDNAGSGILFNHNDTGATIANNLSFANKNHGISISSGGGSGDGFVITNNIVYGNAMFGINVHSDANGADNQYRNNLFYANGKGEYGLDNSAGPMWTPPNTSGTVNADPRFVDYQSDGSGDYHLTAGSPAVDAGTTLGAPDTDYDGTPRPQGNAADIGPYEYH
ncbi:MAG TPA: right-handed parallel beta-helix repeat-containing protein [Pseudonocardiaceae bacterium]|nr:right-handed parallel beta-helix repeat-containing protein [Pseudonocardiaceae bacterium]